MSAQTQFVIVRRGTLSGKPKDWFVSDLGRWALNICSAKKFPTRQLAEAYRGGKGQPTWQIREVTP